MICVHVPDILVLDIVQLYLCCSYMMCGHAKNGLDIHVLDVLDAHVEQEATPNKLHHVEQEQHPIYYIA